MRTRRHSRLSVIEEMAVCLDTQDEPATMHLEVRFSGHVDAGRMSAAASVAARRHPMARARLGHRRLLFVPPRWAFSVANVGGPIAVMHASNETDLARIRNDFFSRGFDLRRAPLWRLLVVHRPDGDSLLLNMHHAISDGVGMARFLGSILRAYAGEPDPVPTDVDPLEIRYLAKNLGEQFPEQPAVEPAPVDSRSYVAPAPGQSGQGYGFVCLRLPRDWKHPERKHRDLRGSRGEYCMHAALHCAMDKWNSDRRQDTGVLVTLIPHNVRDARWKREVVANIVVPLELFTTPAQRTTDADVLETITRQLRAWKQDGAFGASLHPSAFLRWVVAPILFSLPKRQLLRRLPRSAAVLTCAGPADDVARDTAVTGKVVEVWGSPPTVAPTAFAMCVMSLETDVFITLRYHRSLFDDEAAQQFADLYIDALERLTLTGQTAGDGTRTTTSASSLVPRVS